MCNIHVRCTREDINKSLHSGFNWRIHETINKVNAHGEILLHRITMMPDCSSKAAQKGREISTIVRDGQTNLFQVLSMLEYAPHDIDVTEAPIYVVDDTNRGNWIKAEAVVDSELSNDSVCHISAQSRRNTRIEAWRHVEGKRSGKKVESRSIG